MTSLVATAVVAIIGGSGAKMRLSAASNDTLRSAPKQLLKAVSSLSEMLLLMYVISIMLMRLLKRLGDTAPGQPTAPIC